MFKKFIPLAAIGLIGIQSTLFSLDITPCHITSDELNSNHEIEYANGYYLSHMEKYINELNPIELKINKTLSTTIVTPDGYDIYKTNYSDSEKLFNIHYEKGYLFISNVSEKIYETSIDIILENEFKNLVSQKINISTGENKSRYPQILKLHTDNYLEFEIQTKPAKTSIVKDIKYMDKSNEKEIKIKHSDDELLKKLSRNPSEK